MNLCQSLRTRVPPLLIRPYTHRRPHPLNLSIWAICRSRSHALHSTPRQRQEEARIQALSRKPAGKPEDVELIKPENMQKPPGAEPAGQDALLVEQTVSNKEQRKADWAIIKEMSKYLWPKDNFGTRFRVGASVGLLIGAKVLHRSKMRSVLGSVLRLYVGPQCASAILLQKYSRFHEHRLCRHWRHCNCCCWIHDHCLFVSPLSLPLFDKCCTKVFRRWRY